MDSSWQEIGSILYALAWIIWERMEFVASLEDNAYRVLPTVYNGCKGDCKCEIRKRKANKKYLYDQFLTKPNTIQILVNLPSGTKP